MTAELRRERLVEVTVDSVKKRITKIEELNERGVGTAIHAQQFELACLRMLLAGMESEPVAVPDIDMSDADCFSVARLHEIIYGANLLWPEEKLLARFMLDVKQRLAYPTAPEQEV